MNSILVSIVRTYLRLMARLAPRIAGRHAYFFFSTPRTRVSEPNKLKALMARAERFDLEADGHRIAAYRWPAESDHADAPRILLVHGWESRAARLAAWVPPLLDAGFEVAALDAPGHGESDGRRSNPVAFAESIHALVQRVGPVSACVGHSLGGLSSIIATTGGRLMERENLEVDRLVIIAGAETGTDAMAYFCEVLGLGEDFLPLILDAAAEAADGRAVADFDGHRLLAERPIPTLWIHDPEDAEVPFAAAERVARACPHVTLETVEGPGHRRIARDAKVIQRGIEFLAELAPNPVSKSPAPALSSKGEERHQPPQNPHPEGEGAAARPRELASDHLETDQATKPVTA